MTELKKLPDLEDVATDQQLGGLAVYLVIDRVTASRLGIAPSTIDNTMYDAFGQRQINTMYTQVNQYHVILEAQPQFQLDPNKLNHLFIQANTSAGATGAGRNFLRGIGSASAGSNALTTSALYTPSAPSLAPPQNALTAKASTGHPTKRQTSRRHNKFDQEQRRATERLHAFRKHNGSRFRSITRASFQQSLCHSTLPQMRRSAAPSQPSIKFRRTCTCRRACRQIFRARLRRSEFAFQRAAPDSRRTRHRLHRAWRAVRKFCASHHDSIHPAVRRSGRIPGAYFVSPGSERGGHHRHRAADRHREEKRNHDGGLRAGSANASMAKARRMRSTKHACCDSVPS